MEFKDIIKFTYKHYLLLILGLIIGGLTGLVFSYLSPAPYEATSKILISRTKSDKDSDFGYLNDQQLIQTYAYILKTSPILELVNKDVQGKVNPDNVRVSQAPDTMILQITVQDDEAQRAAFLANAFARAMVTQSEQLQDERYALQEEGLNTQITAVQNQIDELQTMYDNRQTTVNQSIIDDIDKQILAYRKEILNLQKEIAAISTPTNLDQENYVIERNARLSEIQPLLATYLDIRTNLEYLGRPYQSGGDPEDTTLARLKTTISQYQDVHLALINSLENIHLAKVQSGPTVRMIEEAIVPTDRASLSFVLNPVILGGVGLILAILIGLVMERKRVKISSQQDLLQSLGLKTIGLIQNIAGNKAIESAASPVNEIDPRSFYDLRAYMEYERIRHPFKTLLITSFSTGDGKSTIASNLAVNYALGRESIVIVDGNFSHPDLHFQFNKKNDFGFADILYKNQELTPQILQDTPVENLAILPAGNYHPGTLQLIDPQKAIKVFSAAGAGKTLVIVDGPVLTDLNAKLLASAVDKILVVMRTGYYSLDGLEEALENLVEDRGKIMGVVLNETAREEIPEIRGAKEKKEEKTSNIPAVNAMEKETDMGAVAVPDLDVFLMRDNKKSSQEKESLLQKTREWLQKLRKGSTSTRIDNGNSEKHTGEVLPELFETEIDPSLGESEVIAGKKKADIESIEMKDMPESKEDNSPARQPTIPEGTRNKRMASAETRSSKKMPGKKQLSAVNTELSNQPQDILVSSKSLVQKKTQQRTEKSKKKSDAVEKKDAIKRTGKSQTTIEKTELGKPKTKKAAGKIIDAPTLDLGNEFNSPGVKQNSRRKGKSNL